VRVARKVGYPVIIKASGGGGGRGMRVVHTGGGAAQRRQHDTDRGAGRLRNPVVYLEKYLENPRHIEFQLLADAIRTWCTSASAIARSSAVTRRSSRNRRRPAFREAARQDGERCVEACRKIGYRGAGTFDFSTKKKSSFSSRMNTRIQVEHPVTEMVTGVDLVQEQIYVATGQKLRLRQKDIQFRGHAIECRINAEDPTGSRLRLEITSYHPPAVRHSRRFARLPGYTVPPYYDSMVGKLIAYGATREQAVARMRIALSEMVVEAS